MLADLKSISNDAEISSVGASAGKGSARLFLTTAPAAAEIYVDDKRRGASGDVKGTILIENLAPGLHSVRVSKTGYADYRISVALEQGQQTDLQVALQARATVAAPPADQTAAGGFETARLEGDEAKTALLVIENLPAGATLLIGSKVVAQADEDGRASVKLAPGSHEIEARATTGETTRRMITVADRDAGALKAVSMPVDKPSKAMQASAPSASSAPETDERSLISQGETAKAAKSRRMAAAVVAVLLLALAAAAYVALRANSDAQPNAASLDPSLSNQESVVAAQQANANQAEEVARAEQAQNINAQPAAEPNVTVPTPPVPTTPPGHPEVKPSQDACIGVRVVRPGGNIVQRARVTLIEQPGTASARSLDLERSPNGLWYRCGFKAGQKVRIIAVGPRGGARGLRVVRDVTLTAGRNSVEIQATDTLDSSLDREPPPPGRRRPRL
jgi:hypothetical protein